MRFDPTLAMVRFGTGLSPRFEPPQSVEAIWQDLTGPDLMAEAHPIPGFETLQPSHRMVNWANRTARAVTRDTTSQDIEAAQDLIRYVRDDVRLAERQLFQNQLARAVDAPHGMRERLTAFWADHFTVRRRIAETSHMVQPYVEDAIRPEVTGSFPAMLRAVVTHPMMLLFLEQYRSIGPNSPDGLRRGAGLNENLARELLELHLLGVDGGYSQDDVRELAELLTGLSYDARNGFRYRPLWAEPGQETVLGLTFSEDPALRSVLTALDELAVLPQTARHLAWKLGVHFVGPTPPKGLIDTLAEAFGPTGDLGAMTRALLDHPAAWRRTREKVRNPQEFVVASLRALGVSGERVARAELRPFNAYIARPMRIMGQSWTGAPGPDGWPEAAEDWIIPQAMAGRISWAMQVPQRIAAPLPDPRDFVRTALGPNPPDAVVFAARAAERRADGIGVVLASPAFQRR